MLEIRRAEDSDTALEGTITNETWYGGADREEPGPCRGDLHYLVTLEAAGTLHGQEIVFEGINWNLDELYCGSSYGFSYALDRFSGTIEPELQEFQSVNNDGALEINLPYVFRRIDCFEPGEEPRVEVEPPPYVPTERSRGCGCF